MEYFVNLRLFSLYIDSICHRIINNSVDQIVHHVIVDILLQIAILAFIIIKQIIR